MPTLENKKTGDVEESPGADNKNGDETEVVPEKDPFAYLNRDEFSSERFKIEVNGLPRHYGFSELRKLFNDRLKVNAHKLIPPKKGCSYMFVNFKSEEERQEGIKKIDGFVWKGRKLFAKPAKAAEDPLVKKRLCDDVDKVEEGFVPNESIADSIRRVTTPWWNVPYDIQLERKMTLISDVFREMKTGILSAHSQLKNTSVLCNGIVEKIKPSPVTEHYRNKCEFSIGYNPESKEKTVGFRLSSYKRGSTAVGPIDTVTHLPNFMVQSALKFQDFVRQSKFEVYDPETHDGCFRQLTVRVTSKDDVMLMVLLSDKKITPEDFQSLKDELKNSFSKENIKSFYVKLLNDHGQPDKTPPELLFGSETITEKLMGLKFEISPEAFFQVNLPATEVLYTAIGSFLEEQTNATLLDVCSGTGTIGLSLASKCSQVLGIEMVPSAVIDARKNAEINSLTEKCDFFAGKAEDITEPVIVRAKSQNIIAIVDPPRAGLHQKVLFTLRKCEKIQTLIYVACNAKAAMKNFIDLSRPSSNAFKGQPFIPVKLIPVDMFPNSPHFELIIVFSRLASVLNESKANKSD
ncbi:tRNA (uracil-5-)-methyltransferase A [Orchesella cincta]|uniref:tRNA (uracil(54)-C(5))-methyltransferase n=1 Tax=Orchesella cincta TaxID=48709 RepID=A0A1D2N8T2_ORCCI|nr:tRNA (uracil-5-)-methyltransferase A [Orchesella cincta]